MKPANDNHPAALTRPQEDGPLGKVYTLDEAADYLKTTKHTVARVARRIGSCSIFGRTMRFSDSDLLAIWDDMRCPSKSSGAAKSGISGAPLLSASEANLSTKAQAFLTRGKRKSTAPVSKAA